MVACGLGLPAGQFPSPDCRLTSTFKANFCKSMGIQTDARWQQGMVTATAVLMVAGLFLSRALLSSGTILFVAACCLHRRFPGRLRFTPDLLPLYCMVALFLLPLLSGLWSGDHTEWLRVLQLKLPLALLPLAFAQPWKPSPAVWRALLLLLLGGILAGALWSLSHYLAQPGAVEAAYLQATLLPTPLGNDHVRFSWLVAAGIVIGWLLLQQTTTVWKRRLGMGLIGFLVLYLHLLAARTGLLCFYLALLLYLLHRLQTDRRRLLPLASGLIALPLLALLLFPTLRNRISYNRYDLSLSREHTYVPGANDANRILSLQGGWELLKANPLGLGAGDIAAASQQWFSQNVPGMQPRDRFYPSSEWLVYGLTAGWPGLLLFSLALLLPLAYRPARAEHRFAWRALHLMAAASFLFDTGLEGQYGVWIYSFLLLWMWKGGRAEPFESTNPSLHRGNPH
jgi:O-antigen ligase